MFTSKNARAEQSEDSIAAAGRAAKTKSAQRKMARGIPESLQTKMESEYNTSFSDVNLHVNSNKAIDVGALAYTQGTNIHIAPGHYNPGTIQGKKLIGHELAHVAQQQAGRVQPTGSVGGLPLNDSPSLEREADSMASKAL